MPDQPGRVGVLHEAGRWGDGVSWNVDEGPHPYEATYLKLDSSRARNELEWRQRLNLDDGIALTVDWYQEDQRQAFMREYTIRQIREFEAAGGK